MPCTLGYWNLRGLGQAIRLLLEYTGMSYQEKRYEFGPAPDFDASQWTNEKYNLGMAFPNLPYFFDEETGLKITQSHAVLKYIARKYGLVAKSEKERVRVEMVEHEAQDLRAAWIKLCYNTKEGFEKMKCCYVKETLKPRLESLSKFLCSHNWFAGDYITYVDFLIYDLLDIHQSLFPCALEEFENLQCFVRRFESLEQIKAYMGSKRFLKSPINGKMAAYF